MNSDGSGYEREVSPAQKSRMSPRVANFVNSVLGRDEMDTWNTYYLGEEGAEETYKQDVKRFQEEVESLGSFHDKRFPTLGDVDMNEISSAHPERYSFELERNQNVYVSHSGNLDVTGEAEGVYLLETGARVGSTAVMDFDIDTVDRSVLGVYSDKVKGNISEITDYSDVELYGTKRSTGVNANVGRVANGSYLRAKGSRGDISLDIGVIENDAIVEATSGRGDYRINVDDIEENGHLIIRESKGGDVRVDTPERNNENIHVVKPPIMEFY